MRLTKDPTYPCIASKMNQPWPSWIDYMIRTTQRSRTKLVQHFFCEQIVRSNMYIRWWWWYQSMRIISTRRVERDWRYNCYWNIFSQTTRLITRRRRYNDKQERITVGRPISPIPLFIYFSQCDGYRWIIDTFSNWNIILRAYRERH